MNLLCSVPAVHVLLDLGSLSVEGKDLAHFDAPKQWRWKAQLEAEGVYEVSSISNFNATACVCQSSDIKHRKGASGK